MGAFLSGWIAASGYYLAYQIFQRRPGRLLLPNILAHLSAHFFWSTFFPMSCSALACNNSAFLCRFGPS